MTRHGQYTVAQNVVTVAQQDALPLSLKVQKPKPMAFMNDVCRQQARLNWAAIRSPLSTPLLLFPQRARLLFLLLLVMVNHILLS